MSIENFFAAYPADSDFVASVARRSEFRTVSPVRFMADILIREGHSGLSEVGPNLHSAFYYGDKVKIKELERLFAVEASSVYLGASLRAIEGILVNRVFDKTEYSSLIEQAFVGSAWNPPFPEDLEDEPITRDNADKMLSVAHHDKTLGTFFNREVASLPRSMRQYLGKTGCFIDINRLVIPDYVARTQLIIAERNMLRNFPAQAHQLFPTTSI